MTREWRQARNYHANIASAQANVAFGEYRRRIAMLYGPGDDPFEWIVTETPDMGRRPARVITKAKR